MNKLKVDFIFSVFFVLLVLFLSFGVVDAASNESDNLKLPSADINNNFIDDDLSSESFLSLNDSLSADEEFVYLDDDIVVDDDLPWNDNFEEDSQDDIYPEDVREDISIIKPGRGDEITATKTLQYSQI